MLMEGRPVHSFTLLLITLLTLTTPSQQTNENQLLGMLKKISPFARPVKNASDAVVVTFGYELVHIVSIVESEQTVTQKIWLRMSWLNEFMTWNSTEFGGVSLTRLNMASVWTPDLFLQEDVSSDMSSGPKRYMTQVILNSNGVQYWYIPALLQSSCIFDVATFPFDHQSCVLVFTPWTHTQNELDLKIDERPVVTGAYVNSSEWDIVSVGRERRSTKYACCPNPYVDIRYTMNLKRKPLYYVYSVIVPCIIQMVIILFTFFLPPDSGERIGVVITVLLVFAVYLEIISNSLPKTSTSTPALSKFYITAMAESACSLIATCLVLIFHFKGQEQGVNPIPKWARRFFLDGLSRYLCVRVYNNSNINSNHNNSNNNHNEHHTKEDEEKYLMNHNKKENSNNGGINNPSHLNNIHHHVSMDTNNHVAMDTKQTNPYVTMDTLVDEVRRITAVIDDQDKNDEIEGDWQTLAKIFDRLFFIAFFFIFLISSMVLLMPIYECSKANNDAHAPAHCQRS